VESPQISIGGCFVRSLGVHILEMQQATAQKLAQSTKQMHEKVNQAEWQRQKARNRFLSDAKSI